MQGIWNQWLWYPWESLVLEKSKSSMGNNMVSCLGPYIFEDCETTLPNYIWHNHIDSKISIYKSIQSLHVILFQILWGLLMPQNWTLYFLCTYLLRQVRDFSHRSEAENMPHKLHVVWTAWGTLICLSSRLLTKLKSCKSVVQLLGSNIYSQNMYIQLNLKKNFSSWPSGCAVLAIAI